MKLNDHINVLSLFDGMACGYIALKNAGFTISRYVAYEIDKYAIQTATHNFPDIEECGDVFIADFTQYEGFDFLIGGSPCTHWSIAKTKNRETTASGIGWDLFSQYVRALNEAKPKYFIYENNKSMSKEIRASIDATFGFEAICINSALVSAQNRQRLYWVGKRNEDGTYSKVNIEQPKDRGILLRDILETGGDLTGNDKSFVLTASYDGACAWNTIERHQRNMVAEPVCVAKNGKSRTIKAQYYKNSAANFITNSGFTATAVAEPIQIGAVPVETDENGKPTKAQSLTDGKIYTVYEVDDGQIIIKGKRYPVKLIDGYYIIRKLTVRECMRLQTVPEWYEFPVSNTRAFIMLGNGWTCEVITHLLNHCKGIKDEI